MGKKRSKDTMPKAKKPAQNETEEEEDNNMTADDKQLDSITDHHQAHELDVNKVNAELAALQAADAAESQAEGTRQGSCRGSGHRVDCSRDELKQSRRRASTARERGRCKEDTGCTCTPVNILLSLKECLSKSQWMLSPQKNVHCHPA